MGGRPTRQNARSWSSLRLLSELIACYGVVYGVCVAVNVTGVSCVLVVFLGVLYRKVCGRDVHVIYMHSASHLLCYIYVAFCTIMAISRQKEAGLCPTLISMTLRVLYSAQYHRQLCTYI